MANGVHQPPAHASKRHSETCACHGTPLQPLFNGTAALQLENVAVVGMCSRWVAT